MNLKISVVALAAAISLALVGSSTYATDAKPTTKSKPKTTVVTVKAGDTLSSIAKKYHTTYVKLFNANKGIENPDVINAGEKVRIPNKGEKLPDRYSSFAASAATYAAAPASAAATTTTYTTQKYTSAPVNSSSYYVGNGMWCTDYVHSRRSDVPVYGNAGYNWISAAQADGKATGTTPKAGAVAVTNGHVAYVESVNSDGSYVVSEMGWNYTAGEYNKRTVQPGTFGGFIY
ncbi:MAG TPA: LysM peptidoglycan-binding domain-containing protein [Patescibacteria group bacterium]|jgi:surface antigen|nr:LysM peptidoglycan-binding domain-containing protein [Patescibacteria group bacterium]